MPPLLNLTHEAFNLTAREPINGFKRLTVTITVTRLPSRELRVSTIKITKHTAHPSVKLVVAKFQIARTGVVTPRFPCGRFPELVMAVLGRAVKRTTHITKAAILRRAMRDMLAKTPAWDRGLLLRAVKSMGLDGLEDVDVFGDFDFNRPREAAAAGLRRSLRIADRRQQAQSA